MGTIGDALFGSTKQAALRLFFSNVNQRFYMRDIIRRLNLGTGSVQTELATLTKAGVLTRTKDGNQVYYQANPESPIFEDLRNICAKTFGIADTLLEALRPLNEKILFAFVYGSMAAGTESTESDVDLMIVGDSIKLSDAVPLLAKASHRLSREVNPTIYGTKEFFTKLQEKRHFISTVLDGPKIFIVGSERELRRMAKEGVAEGPPKQRRGDRKPH